MTTIDQQRAWLRLLEAELGRRIAREEWTAREGDRQREAFAAELQEMARRLGAMADKYPLDLADMSVAEMLAANLLPKHMRPAGLPSEAKIWADYRARRKG